MSTIENSKKERQERRLQTCKHFNGIQHKTCRAGVAYESVRTKGPIPCLPPWREGAACLDECSKRELPTGAEVEAREAAMLKSLDNTRTAIVAITEKIGRWKKGMGGTQGEMPCPVCKTGTLGYSRSGYNGHLWGACTTPTCVRWMQ